MRNYLHDCSTCTTRCDGISKGIYRFKNDTEYSEIFEKQIIDTFSKMGLKAEKSTKDGYPDLVITNPLNNRSILIEVKVQRRTFMQVKNILPKSDLVPSNTLALNLSDLVRYFEINKIVKEDIFLVWVLSERPCITNSNTYEYFIQKVEILENIYEKYGDMRRFRRKSGLGDVVDGVHKGVVVNYHFGINELEPMVFEDFARRYLS